MKLFFSVIGGACLACAMPVIAQVKNSAADVKAGVEAWQRADYTAAIAKWRPAANAGDADAQFNLGQAYKLGWGVPMDLPVATEWFRKAAAQGHVRAEDNYGLLLFRSGKRPEAMPYIQKSASRGEPRAQYILGTALFNGENVQKDWVRGYAMMTRAVAQGLPQATTSLALMDQYIPMDQRQEATKLAAELEKQERSNMLAGTKMPQQPATGTSAGAPFASTSSAKPKPILPTDLPPSTVAGTPMVQPIPAPAVPAAKPSTKPVEKPAVAKAPTPATKSATLPAGNWRVQLGAFSDEAKARTLWTNLLTRVKGLDAYQPYLVKENAVTRLQAGPVASQSAALKLCATVRKADADCIVKQR
ncbi:cell division septation protein DedD [Rhizorhapis suberifaciens]|uniref:Cell division septation protein DedD n=1 Tax=Rhizorhapis suberifaciens TaxID=13656 RepID=A0A840HPZ1_9SPHN|nr:SPOR domain-containing protein [Rhizorhapis suberifaciens]MBB4639985.1 cell division septation protein DedD [Rhizorhapis suberifaciens]